MHAVTKTVDLNQKMKEKAVELLQKRGVSLEEIAELVLEIQKVYIKDLILEDCLESVEHVLAKREVQNAVFTGITMDELAEQSALPEPLLTILKSDDDLYGVDEILALSIINIYGSIGMSNFGYLDKIKPGIIGKLNHKKNSNVNTFLDDIVAAIAAAAAARIAHRIKDLQNMSKKFNIPV